MLLVPVLASQQPRRWLQRHTGTEAGGNKVPAAEELEATKEGRVDWGQVLQNAPPTLPCQLAAQILLQKKQDLRGGGRQWGISFAAVNV